MSASALIFQNTFIAITTKRNLSITTIAGVQYFTKTFIKYDHMIYFQLTKIIIFKA